MAISMAYDTDCTSDNNNGNGTYVATAIMPITATTVKIAIDYHDNLPQLQ